MSEHSQSNVPNPHRERLIKEYPQRPLIMPPPGFPVDRAIVDEQVLADTTGLVRWVAWVDSAGESHLREIQPDPFRRSVYRGRLDQ